MEKAKAPCKTMAVSSTGSGKVWDKPRNQSGNKQTNKHKQKVKWSELKKYSNNDGTQKLVWRAPTRQAKINDSG